MPASFVAKGEEKTWKRAKKEVRKGYPGLGENGKFWAITNHIFHNMTGKRTKTAMAKSDYVDMAKVAVLAYIDEQQDLGGQATKIAVDNGLNPDEIQNLCVAINHAVYISLAKKAADDKAEDQNVDFKIARPEDVMSMLAEQLEDPDDIYENPAEIFQVEKQAREPGLGVAEFEQQLLRKGQILEHNIKNVSLAHEQVRNKLGIETVNAHQQLDKLYQIVAQSVASGKNHEVVKIAIEKVFDDKQDFRMVWDFVESNLIANNLVRRDIRDTDRPEVTMGASPAILSVNPASQLVATASEFKRRLGRIDQLEAEGHVLEEMAKEASEDLYQALLLQKQAVIGGLLVGGARLLARAVPKALGAAGKGAKWALKPRPPKRSGRVGKVGKGITALFIGMDATTAAGGKATRLL